MTQPAHRHPHPLDADLRTAVIAELTSTPDVDLPPVGVLVNDGVVTLSGEVGSFAEKRDAEQAVQRVRGVAQQMTAQGAYAAVTDTDIARLAGNAVENLPDVPLGGIKISVHDRVVTLSGTVPWLYQRESAVRAVCRLRGVTSVHDLVLNKPAVSTDDIRTAITEALVRDEASEGQQCHVTADTEGAVTITGTVESWLERRQSRRSRCQHRV